MTTWTTRTRIWCGRI